MILKYIFLNLYFFQDNIRELKHNAEKMLIIAKEILAKEILPLEDN